MLEFLDKEIITESDINDVITNQIEESINLDFKAGAALAFSDKTKAEIAKDVSAFANSAGGYIIYGLSERNHRADAVSPFDGSVYTKEWLEQLLQTRIQRKIEGLIIKPIRIEHDIKKSIYVIKIPESSSAPHMTSDKKFYKRYNFESVQMEEYEIRNLYNRKHKTELYIHNIYVKDNLNNKNILSHFVKEFAFQIENRSNTVEKDYKLILEIYGSKYASIVWDRSFRINYSTGNDDQLFVSILGNTPIFPNEILTIGTFTLEIPFEDRQFLLENGKMNCKLQYSNGMDSSVIEDFANLLLKK